MGRLAEVKCAPEGHTQMHHAQQLSEILHKHHGNKQRLRGSSNNSRTRGLWSVLGHCSSNNNKEANLMLCGSSQNGGQGADQVGWQVAGAKAICLIKPKYFDLQANVWWLQLSPQWSYGSCWHCDKLMEVEQPLLTLPEHAQTVSTSCWALLVSRIHMELFQGHSRHFTGPVHTRPHHTAALPADTVQSQYNFLIAFSSIVSRLKPGDRIRYWYVHCFTGHKVGSCFSWWPLLVLIFFLKKNRAIRQSQRVQWKLQMCDSCPHLRGLSTLSQSAKSKYFGLTVQIRNWGKEAGAIPPPAYSHSICTPLPALGPI